MSEATSHSPHSAVVGLQWGDEGKGKIVDLLTPEHDVIVRYNGGANAGHTVVVGEERYALHQVPSGILSPGGMSVIANGVVVDPARLVDEIQGLRNRDVDISSSNLRLSDRAHVVMPYHIALDEAIEEFLAKQRNGKAIGTTRRGIGPAYADKVLRSTAIRVGDLLDESRLREQLEVICPLREAQLRSLGMDAKFDPASEAVRAAEFGNVLRPFITDTTWLLHDEMRAGKRLLFEGANACLLDVDHGTFPYVTSSNCSTLGIPPGTGVPMSNIGRVLGIMKAYSTRVGAGPFPTELDDAIGNRIRERGREYGTTTGRPRRCGWLDLVAVRYTSMVCGVTGIACTLFDVLGGFDEVRLCTSYRLPDGSTTDRFTPDAASIAGVEPIYETFPGWDDFVDQPLDRNSLPVQARRYLDRIEEFVGVGIEIVGVGPERTEVLVEA